MAKYGSTLAEVKVHINGKEQAKKEIEELKAVAKSYSDQMELANNQMLEAAKKLAEAREEANKAATSKGVDSAEYKQAVDKELRAQTEYDTAQKEFKVNEKEWKKYQKLIKESEKLTVDLEEALQHLSEQDIATLNKLRRSVEAVRNKVMGSDDPNKEFLNQLNDALNQIVDTIDNKKGKLIEFSDIIKDLSNIDDTSLAKAERRLRSLLAATDKGDVERIKQLKDELSQVTGERQRRVGVEAEAIMGGDYTKTIEGTKQAIELLKKYQETLDTTDTAGIERVQNAIKQMNAELETASREFAAKVMDSPFSFSTEEIEEAIKITQKLQATTKDVNQYNEYARQISEARRAQQEFVDGAKLDAMSEQLKLLPGLSEKALQEQQKYWQAMIEGAGKADTALTTYRENLQKTMDEERRRLQDSMKTTQSEQMLRGGVVKKSVGDIKELIKDYERLESLTDATDAAGLKEIRDVIANLRQQLKQTEAGFLSFDDALDKAKTIAGGTFDGTLEDLAKIKKSIEEGINTKLNLSDPDDIDRLKEAQKLLEDIAKEQREAAQARLEEQAKATQEAVEKGTYKGTIEETEKAIELQKQYMKLLDDTDAAGVKKVEDTIEALQNRLKQAKDELMDYSTAMKQVEQIQNGTWKGTLEDLDKIKKSLEYHKQNKLQIGADSDDLKEVNKALNEIDKAAKGVNMSMSEVEALLKDLDSASVEDLEKAARKLQEELHDAARGTEDYVKAAAKLREVNAELKKAKKEWEGQENVIVKTTKRLMAYVAVYGGFNAIIDKMKEVVQLNLQLSDSLADVQKTTGLTGVELQELGRSLERIDTRTATTELYNLAAAAGQIGLKTQEDVLGFAKAANTISVALNELGAEGSASLMKIATLTGEVGRYGTEDALLKVGSAINELTANSAATAGPIADFIARVGGIASASKMAISDMAALGAAADASGQSIEIAGTSMNKLISALVSNTENIAYAANVSVTELQSLIDQGETMQAVVRIFEAMQNMDRGGMNELMKELGSEGARMNQFVASMVANLDLLKRQLNISREAFDENVSVINEYNVKQESALGILQRMKNAFLDTFVNSKMTVVLKDVLEAIAAIPGVLAKMPGLLLTIKIIIAQILLFKLPFLLHNLMMQLSGMYKLLAGPVYSAFKAFHTQILRTMVAARQSGASINYLSGALRVLGRVIAAHPIMTLASIVTAGVVAWMHFRDKVDEVTKVTNELSQKHSRQIEELNALRSALESVNTSYATRAAAMREINSLYGKYLGFELSELDNYGKKARALDLINAKLKENQALELKNERQGVIQQEFKESSEGDLERMEEVLTKIPEISRERWTEALAVMNKAIKDGAETSSQVAKELDKYFDTDKVSAVIDKMEGQKKSTESVYMKWYIDKYSAFLKDMKTEDDSYNNAQTQNRKETYERQIDLFEEQQRIVDNLRNDQSKRTEAEQRLFLQELQKEQKDLLAISEQLFESAKEQDFAKIEDNLGKDQMFDVEAIRKNVSEATAARAEGMNELIKQRETIRQVQQETNDEVKHLESQLVVAQAKKNNEEEVNSLKASIEEKKALRDQYGKEIFDIDSKWNDEFQSMQTKNASETKLRWLETVKSIKDAINEIQGAIDGDPFGKLLNLKSWKGFDEIINPTALKETNASSIVNVYKKLREDYLQMSGDLKGLNEMFDFKVPMTSLDQAQQQIFSWAEQLRNELRRRGLTTTGMMIDKDPKSMVDNTLNKLKTHFIKRQNEIRQAFINGSISSAEMNRRIAANDEELLKARVELRKRLMNEASYFNQALYPELKDVDIQRIVAAVGTADTEVRDALKEGLAEDENLVTEGAIKIREAIEKELAASNPFTALDTQLQSSLDELSLMTSEFERKNVDKLVELGVKLTRDAAGNVMGLDKETQRNRLEFLMEMAKQSYTIDAEGLRKIGMNHKEHYNWIGNLTEQELQLMLAKLQKYYDDALVAQDNFANRLRKSAKASYDQQGLKLGELGEIQWEIDSHVEKRDALRRTLLSDEAKKMSKERIKEIQDEIGALNIAINRAEEDRDKILEKLDREGKSRKAKKERETKEEMEASISALKAFYKEQEAVIRQNALDNNWTPEDLERKLAENKIKAETDAMELRKKLLGDPSNFDPFANDSYKGAITGTVFFGNTRDLEKQADQIKQWGKGFRDGMRNEIAQSSVEIAKEMQKVSDVIKNALLEGDMFGKFENDFATMLDELGILTSNLEDDINKSASETFKKIGVNIDLGLSEEGRSKRVEALTKFADQSYQINETRLRELMAQNTQFALWANNLTDEEMTVLLGKLRNYYDDRIELTRKYQDKLAKEFESYYQQTGQQGEYEARKQKIDKGNEEREQLESFGITRGVDYDAKRQGIAEEYQNESDVLSDKAAFLKERLATLQEGSAEYLATQKLITDTELAQNQLLADSQKALTQVYMDEWTKRAERWGQWGEMFGEYLGEQVMLEKQANDARARGDLETAKKIEQQQKQNKQALIQNLLNKIVDEAALWAKEYALKMMFNSLMLAEDKKKAIEEVSLQGKQSMLSIFLNALTGQSKEHSKGLSGLVTGAIIFAATMALQAFAKSAIANMFPEAASGSTANRKLSTGMLTYAEGNYPVLGNDGKVYDAKYEGAGMKTGIYGGGAHFGIFSEKQPEMIVDGKTTQKLILNYPYIYDAITTIAKNGRLVNAMPTFASGDYPAGMNRIAQMEAVDVSGGSNEDMIQMRATMDRTNATIDRLSRLLEGGIVAHLDGLENHKQQKKNERFLKRRGID